MHRYWESPTLGQKGQVWFSLASLTAGPEGLPCSSWSPYTLPYTCRVRPRVILPRDGCGSLTTTPLRGCGGVMHHQCFGGASMSLGRQQ